MGRTSAANEETPGLAMPLNHVGGQVFRAPPPITRPPINLPPLDTKAIEAEAREAQARVRVIRAGRDAWEAINRSASFELYLAIGKALAEGRRHALKVSGANAPWGRNYSREFGEWMNCHGFATMPKLTRSVAIELHENAEAITAWRDTLPSASASGSFTRYRLQDAGEPLRRTATASAHRT